MTQIVSENSLVLLVPFQLLVFPITSEMLLFGTSELEKDITIAIFLAV
jgi:hypothetical protein